MKALRFVGMALALLATPVVAYAQACMGAPIAGGQYGIEAGMGIGDGFKSYSGGVAANLNGPLAFGIAAGITQPDEGGENMKSAGLNGGFEVLQSSRVSVCPTVGVIYSMASMDILGTEFDMNQIMVPVGLGLGTTLPASSMNVTLFATPQFLWYRTSLSADGESVSDTSNEFGVNAGVRFGVSSFYAGAGMSMTSMEDDEPVFNFGLGFVVGGRR